jgi:arylsulfatase A-like enzyme
LKKYQRFSKSIFQTILILLCVTGVGHAAKADEPAAARPNVVFLFADDWGRYASVYAETDAPGGLNEVIRTPHIDSIARAGVLFRNAFINAPSCTPCRSSIVSGQYFWRTGRGAILNGAQWDSSIPVWPLLLRDAGYQIGKSYKVWSPGTPADAPFGEKEYAFENAGGAINGFSQRVTKRVQEGAGIDEAKQEILEQVRENFRGLLAAREPGQPFAYWYGPTNVHRTWVRGSGQALWGIDPEQLKGRLPGFLPDVDVVREDLADYFGEIQAFDASVGVILDELRAAGELENTIVIVSGDHGPPGFPHGKCNLYDFGTGVTLAISGPGVNGGRVVDDFTILPDLAPTILEAAKIERPPVMTARSLWPTLSASESGQVDPSRTFVVTGRERHVSTARAGNLPYPQRAIRTRDFLLIVNFHPERYPLGDPKGLDGEPKVTDEEILQNTRATFADEDASPTKVWMLAHRDDPQWKRLYEINYERRPREELYDLREDPDQIHNVAADERYAATLNELRDQLFSELQRTDDPRMIDDGRVFEEMATVK